MKTKLLLGPMLLFSAFCSAKEPELPAGSIMTMRIDGELTIDTSGKVMAYDIATPLEPAVKQAVDRAVSAWRFSPVMLDGSAVRARTGMRVTLAARAVDAGYAISVDNVTFRDPPGATATKAAAAAMPEKVRISKSSMTPPKYPIGVHRAGITGQVLLYLHLSMDGKPEDVVAYQSTLFNARGSDKAMQIAREQFEKEAVRAARGWRFKVDTAASAEQLDPSDLTVTVPILYRFAADPEAAGAWRIELRGERATVPWLLAEKDVRYAGVSDVDGDDVLPLSDAFEFIGDPVGKAL